MGAGVALTLASSWFHSDIPAGYSVSTRGVSWSSTTKGPLVNLQKATKRLTEIFLMQTCDFLVIPFPVITLDHYCWFKPMSALKFSIRHVRRTNSAQGGQAHANIFIERLVLQASHAAIHFAIHAVRRIMRVDLRA